MITPKLRPTGSVAPKLAEGAGAAKGDEGGKAPQQLAVEGNCMACHGVDTKMVGPSFRQVADKYKDVPGAIFVEGNLPKDESTGTHTVDDVVLQAAGPGAEEFKGYMEESDVYKVLANTFALGVKQ